MRTPAGDAVVDVVMDQRPLGLGHRTFDSVQLGGQIDARAPLLDHAYHAAQMPFGAFQPGGNGGVACVDVRFYHKEELTPRGG